MIIEEIDLQFYRQKRTKHFNSGRHTRTSGTSKAAIGLTIASPSLQPILSWNVTDSPLCNDHCMITVNVQSKNSEPQATITKFNINKANWHLFTSIKVWKEIKNPNRSQSAEALAKDFLKKNLNFRKICYTNDTHKKNTSPSPGGVFNYKN